MILGKRKTVIERNVWGIFPTSARIIPGSEKSIVDWKSEPWSRDFVCLEDLILFFDIDLEEVKYIWFIAHDKPAANRVKVEPVRLEVEDKEDWEDWEEVMVDGKSVFLEHLAARELAKYAGKRNVVYVEVEVQ